MTIDKTHMKSINIAVIIFLLILTSCQNKNTKQVDDSLTNTATEAFSAIGMDEQKFFVGEGKTNEYDPKTTLYFSHAFIYEYWIAGAEEERDEFWIFHSPETGNLLYVPN